MFFITDLKFTRYFLLLTPKVLTKFTFYYKNSEAGNQKIQPKGDNRQKK